MGLNSYETAIADFEIVLKLRPDFSEAYYVKGLSYLNLNHKDEACIDFKKAKSLNHANASDCFDRYCK